MLTRKEFEFLRDVEATEPVISARELSLKEGTLLFGTQDDLRIHVYKALGNTLHIVCYNSKNQLLGHKWGSELLLTDCATTKNGKWIHPACCDYQMVAIMRGRGAKLGFKNYEDVPDDAAIWFGAVANRAHTSDFCGAIVLTESSTQFD